MTAQMRGTEVSQASALARGRLQQVNWPWFICSLLAASLILVAAFLPLWKMELKAPQYPKGLFITAYGYGMTGDINEINGLNHYVGVKPIEPDEIVELKLFPFGVAAVLVGLLVGSVTCSRWKRRWLPVVLAWSIPAVMLIDLQYWLYNYGHDLNPNAALRLPKFTPKVLGTTRVVNFHTETMVAYGFWLLVAAALIVTIGPEVWKFLRDSWKNTGGGTARAAVAAVVVGTCLFGLAPRNARAESFSIGRAIETAQPGDVITVPAGTYHEQIIIQKAVVIDGGGNAVIDGDRRGDVIVVDAPGVTIRNLTVQGTSRDVADEPAAIKVFGDGAVIEGNVVRDSLYGIVLEDSDNHVVRGNKVSSIPEFPVERRGHLLYLYNTNDNLIEDNVLTLGKDGLFFGFASRNTVLRNSVSLARYGIHYMYSDDNVMRENVLTRNTSGAALMYSRGLELTANEFSYNRSRASGYGLLLKDIDDLEMDGNLVHHNRVGLTMDGAPRAPESFVTLRDNLVGYNQVALELFTTTDVTFTGNSFIGNLRQVESRGGGLAKKNTWSLDGRGNYWDDYRGYDANGDGVGDIPYRYRGVFDDLVQRNDAVKAWDHTPARIALDLAAQIVPSFQPEARAIDEHPLMEPIATLSREHSPREVAVGLLFAGSMVAIAAAFLVGMTRSPARRWSQC